MNRALPYIVCGLVSALLFVGARARAAEMPAVGAAAPDFTLAAQDGKPVALHDYRGQWVVLYFYPRDFTSGCTLEAHGFQRDLAQYTARHAVVLGVSVDAPEKHQAFCTKEGLNFKLLADTTHDVSTRYGSLTNLGITAFATRNSFIIDPQGHVAKIFTGVQPATHSRDVLAALDALQHKQ